MTRLVAILMLLGLPLSGMAEEVSPGKGAVIRTLDKINGMVEDIELANREAVEIGRIKVTLGECRFPVGNPAGDAYAFLTVTEEGRDSPVFIGWMIASSPALSAMDHPRYDVWVLRCITE
ncbi:DUF2155 domain-containing protein [Aquicoccus porphyridii]|uniref:DUF2155 domain-containing protein n=1 Tax=Aquicoccus porphyridii TaxID=1852029 RepID=UPI00273DB930|nr:DUF2155 domain-containing protein [Aquicoccus porphyridii]